MNLPKLKRLLFIFSIGINLVAAACLGYLIHRRGGINWVGVKLGIVQETPSRQRSFLGLVTELNYPVRFFSVDGHSAFLILPAPAKSTKPIPWVWSAPVLLPLFPNEDNRWMFNIFLERGIAIAGIDVGESYGNPEGCRIYTKFYEFVCQRHGLSSQPALMPRSRGGLMLYNWAVQNPSRVRCIAGIYPVCDLRSYPGLEKASKAYGMTVRELEAGLTQYNPIDRLKPLAEAGVPILHVHGDEDEVVPIERNSAELARRYREFGGNIRLVIIPNKGHVYSELFFQNQQLVDFVLEQLKTP